MLIFSNPGLIDETAITTIAVNAKTGNNPIGVFGTGLKYAIAIILRLGGRVTIYRGLKKLEFGIKTKTIRGKEFDIITMNGRQLGFTTHLGHHWQPWMAYRELWSNARDEEGTVRYVDTSLEPDFVQAERKTTKIIVHCRELDEVHMDRHSIVLGTEPIVTLKGVEVHPGPSKFIYYRGIRVMEIPNGKESIYTYNIIETQILTEDRTLNYPYVVPVVLARNVITATQRPFLSTILHVDNAGKYEGGIAYSSVESQQPSLDFMEVAEQLREAKKLNGAALKLFKHYQDTLPGYVSPYIVQLTPIEQMIADKAISLIQDRVPQLPTPYKIQFKNRMEVNKMTVSKHTITLDHALIEQGHRVLARHMLEGFCILQGGGIVEQLAALILDGKFIPDELTSELPSREDDGVPL